MTTDAVDASDLTLSEVLAFADAHAGLPLIFHHDGRPVKPGYHVTEVKAGRFEALDCGATPEAWAEIFVQLWDVDGGERTHIAAGKFAKIIRKVADHVGLDTAARLTFEVSDGKAPMQLHRATLPEVRAGALHVALLPRAASCKPRDRWLDLHRPAKATACCG